MKKLNLPLIFLVVLGVVFQSLMMVRSGRVGNFVQGVGYWGPLARDGVWHEALVGQLERNLFPQNPGFSGQPLANYHYFYDLMVALIHRLTAIPANTLIYIIFPIFFSISLGSLTYKLANILFKDRWVSLLAVFFTFFGSSFGWIVEYVKRGSVWGGESTFWASQPVSMNLNPPFAISLVLVVTVILLLNSYLKTPTKAGALIIAVLAGILVGFKAYAGVVVLAGLFILGLKRLFVEEDWGTVGIFVVSAVLTAAYLFGRGTSSGLITFLPLWLIDSMIDAGDRVGIVSFTTKRFAYLATEKWLYLFILEMVSFVIFFVGNLGTRIIAILGLNKKDLESDLHIFIFGLMVASLIPALLFVQKGNPWNIVQFLYYFLYFAGLFAARALTKAPKVIVLAVLVLTPISSVATFRSSLYPNPPAYLPAGEYQALTFLKSQPDGVVLKHPYDPTTRAKFKDPYPLLVYADNAYVSANSGKTVYLEDVEQQIILDTSYKQRLDDLWRFFTRRDLAWSADFLRAKIDYLYLPKLYQLPAAEQEYPMVKIFENDAVNIYRVVK